jgi:IS4 transposase
MVVEIGERKILWGTTWYRYLTNVLDPEKLSPQEICQFYRIRWRIEEAFLLTKRLLGLSYLWVGGRFNFTPPGSSTPC